MSTINHSSVYFHPFSVCFTSSEGVTVSGVKHNALEDNGNNATLFEYMKEVLPKHHMSPASLERHKKLIESLKIQNLPRCRCYSYPHDKNTQKGNFAEIFLAEYLVYKTGMELPIYRLRYNPNPEQSMKGDDVLLFDLNSDPVRIVVGEAKFRNVPNKKAVSEIIDGLIRSNKCGVPISLTFVAERLYDENRRDLGDKVFNCLILFAQNKLDICYVGFLMGNQNAKKTVNAHTTSELHNLWMISLGIQNPEEIVQRVFEKSESEL